ncbi:MAG: TIGR01244 family phosphatase, partial [Geminicoccaceae bacterium]|nr:TIGR01244 family phosphatase [Geminicoccaceae bacterium]
MQLKQIDDRISVSAQIMERDLAELADRGFRSVICNRPDGETGDQPNFDEIARAAKEAGVETRYLPVVSGKVSDEDARSFGRLMSELPGPILAYCRTGTRSATLWSLDRGAKGTDLPSILAATAQAGYDMHGVVRRIANGGKTPIDLPDASHDIVIIGGGAAGISVAASLLSRKGDLDIAIIDPADAHYYQPGWTLVGAGVFAPEVTAKTMGGLIPR